MLSKSQGTLAKKISRKVVDPDSSLFVRAMAQNSFLHYNFLCAQSFNNLTSIHRQIEKKSKYDDCILGSANTV